MAGYIFAVAKDSWNDFCEENLKKGFFAPFVSMLDKTKTARQTKSIYNVLLASYADLVTMKAGDNIYFCLTENSMALGMLSISTRIVNTITI